MRQLEGLLVAALSREGLGLERGRVALLPHDPRWVTAFLLLKKLFREKLPSLSFHHAGSTAIRGIPAKPILDLLATADSLTTLDAQKEKIEALGFEWKGEYGIAGRRYCVLYDDEKKTAYAHLHAFAEGHPEVETHLLFRDYLRAHPERAQAYAQLKLQLAAQVSREEYTEAKAPLIRDLLAEARAWMSG